VPNCQKYTPRQTAFSAILPTGILLTQEVCCYCLRHII